MKKFLMQSFIFLSLSILLLMCTKCTAICEEQKPSDVIVDIFLFTDFNNLTLCKWNMQKQTEFIKGKLFEQKKFSFFQKKVWVQKLDINSQNQIDNYYLSQKPLTYLNNYCEQVATIANGQYTEVNHTQTLLIANKINGGIRRLIKIYFFDNTTNLFLNILKKLTRWKVCAFVYIKKDKNANLILEEERIMEFSIDNTTKNNNFFKNSICKIQFDCSKPPKFLEKSFLVSNISNSSLKQYYGDVVNYGCNTNNHKKPKDHKNHTMICGFFGNQMIQERNFKCEEIFCKKPIASENVYFQWESNYRGNNFNKSKNQSIYKFLAIISAICPKNYQIDSHGNNYIQYSCVSNGSQYDITYHDYLYSKITCSEVSCDHIKELKNAKITKRTKTKVYGVCNKGYKRHGIEELFYTCIEIGGTILVNGCKRENTKPLNYSTKNRIYPTKTSRHSQGDDKNKAKNSKLIALKICLSVLFGIICIGLAIYIYKQYNSTKRKQNQAKFQNLEKTKNMQENSQANIIENQFPEANIR